MHYYQFNIGDYASSTQHLDDNEDLAYRRMLDIYYSKESALPEDQNQIARLIRMRTHSDSIATVLSEFFVLKKDGYHCARADKEIKAFKAKSDSAKRSAQARWSKNKDIEPCERIPNAKQTQSDGNAKHKPLNIKQEPLTNSKDLLCEEAFAIFYSAGLVKKSKVKALLTFKSLVKQMECDPLEFAELLKSDVQYRINNNQFGINKLHPSTYLNQQRWTDEHDSEKDDFRYTQGNGKQSAAERIRERNEREYGSQQPSGGMGMAADGGDIRGAVGEGTRGGTIIDMESGS